MDDCKLIQLFEQHNIRPTQQRIAVYRHLAGRSDHPSADTIYKELLPKFPVLSRTTIYNTFRVLAEAGMIRVVSITPDEQRFDADTKDHGHFLCTECGRITDLHIDGTILENLCPDGCKVTQRDIFLNGTCLECNIKG